MSGFAEQQQKQPRLINNIIVFFHGAAESHPAPFLSVRFKLWQRAVDDIAEPPLPSTETKHKGKVRSLTQRALLCLTLQKTYLGVHTKKVMHRVFEYALWIICYCYCYFWAIITSNLDSELMISMSATSKQQEVKFTYISASKQTRKHESVSRECVHVCTYSKPELVNLGFWSLPL